MIDNKKLFLGIVSSSIIAYNRNDGNFTSIQTVRLLYKYVYHEQSPLIPVGTIKALYVYPVKSCKGKKVFSMYCTETGPISREVADRSFIVINGRDGKFYTVRQKPRMVTIESDVQDGVLTMKWGEKTASVKFDDALERRDARTAKLFHEEVSQGLDCGEEMSAFLFEVLEEPYTRLLMYEKGLYSNRGCVIERRAWNKEIPLRTDRTPYADDAPYMINTQASLDDLNTRLKNKRLNDFGQSFLLTNALWDEDKWLSVHIGDVALQCLKPCLRCVMTTIDPSTGEKDPSVEPLKILRQCRLAPEGPMSDDCKDNPMFGVDCGLIHPGYIHVGQTVFVQYKSEYLKQTPFYSS